MEWIIGSLLLVTVVCIIFLKKQKQEFSEKTSNLTNELESNKQHSASLEHDKRKLQDEINTLKSNYQILTSEKETLQSQSKMYLEEISELLEKIEETNKKLNFYQNIEEDSGNLNIAQDTEERQQLLEEVRQQLESNQIQQNETGFTPSDKVSKITSLDEEQYAILADVDRSNKNFFITGKAGTGKSFLLDVFRMSTCKSTIVLAPTGIAALNVKGATIHSVFGYDNLVKLDVDRISSRTLHLKSEKILALKTVSTIIIDEISMVRADTFDKIDRILRVVNNNNLPFGGKQILLFGDLFQLAPIAKSKEREYLYDKYGGVHFFCSNAYKQGNFDFRELTINHRQKEDEEYYELLNRVRDGSITKKDIALLNSRVEKDSSIYDRFTTLLPKKAEVEQLNQYHISRLETTEHKYEANVTLDKRSDKSQNWETLFPISSTLCLKKGALIMMVANDPEHRWVNGTLGIVSNLSPNSISVSIDKRTYEIQPIDFTEQEIHYENGEITYRDVLKVMQYPLVLAYAMTIHKSQGQTYRNIVCDIDACFADGQAYVALSRCCSLNGLHLRKPITGTSIRADKTVLDFYNRHVN